jgi:hypothetical protein
MDLFSRKIVKWAMRDRLWTELASATTKGNDGWAVGDRGRDPRQDPARRVTVRQEKSAAIVTALFNLWEKELPRLSGKSKLAEAIRYAASRRIGLERFLGVGRIVTPTPSSGQCGHKSSGEKWALRGQPWRWSDLGDHRHAAAEL